MVCCHKIGLNSDTKVWSYYILTDKYWPNFAIIVSVASILCQESFLSSHSLNLEVWYAHLYFNYLQHIWMFFTAMNTVEAAIKMYHNSINFEIETTLECHDIVSQNFRVVRRRGISWTTIKEITDGCVPNYKYEPSVLLMCVINVWCYGNTIITRNHGKLSVFSTNVW